MQRPPLRTFPLIIWGILENWLLFSFSFCRTIVCVYGKKLLSIYQQIIKRNIWFIAEPKRLSSSSLDTEKFILNLAIANNFAKSHSENDYRGTSAIPWLLHLFMDCVCVWEKIQRLCIWKGTKKNYCISCGKVIFVQSLPSSCRVCEPLQRRFHGGRSANKNSGSLISLFFCSC